MIDHKLAVEHIHRKKKMILLTIGLLFIAFYESYYLSCKKTYSPLWCELSWIYIFLMAVMVFVVWWYRK